MDWSRTKTIFILTFLVLDLFLGFQLYQKQTENKFDYISESFLKIEDQLKNLNIRYPDTLPDVPKKLVHIIGQTHKFTDEELSNLKHSNIAFSKKDDAKQLIASYDEPKSIPSDADMESIIEANTLFSEDYTFSEYLSSEGKELVFFQTYEGRPIYQKEENANGQITVKLNNDKKVSGFTQTYLDTYEQGEEQEILTAIKAINQLLISNKLKSDDKISFIELGYYSLVEGELQVLAPTWLVEVNNERHYYVNAFNGLIDDPNRETPELGEENTE